MTSTEMKNVWEYGVPQQERQEETAASVPVFSGCRPAGMWFSEKRFVDLWNSLHSAPARSRLAQIPLPQATKLELKGIKVTYTDQEKKHHHFAGAVPCSCKSWMCPDCRKQKGWQVRQAILQHADAFQIPRLYTITINRSYFDSPEQAYDYVMNNKFIARLLTKEMKVKRWVWALEVQEKTGEGYPHWHILIDLADLPGMWYHRETKRTQKTRPADLRGWHYHAHFFDLNKVHRLLKKWRIGEQCELSLKRGKFQNAAHAIRYITKYLIKMPSRGFPPWMLKKTGIRFVQPSHAVGSLRHPAGKKDHGRRETGKKRGRTLRTPLEKITVCRRELTFLEYDELCARYRFVAKVKCTRDQLKAVPGVEYITKFSGISGQPYLQYGFSETERLNLFLDAVNLPAVRQAYERRTECLRWLSFGGAASRRQAAHDRHR